MEILSIILLIITGVLIMFITSSTLVLIPDYKWYKKTYKLLPSLKFNPATDYKYNQIVSNNHNIIWFANKNNFKIGPSNYLHNQYYTYLSPYSLYWYIKYKKWFKKNCSHLTYKLEK